MIFAYRNVDSPDGDFGLVKQEGDERFVVLTVEEYAALRETEARANTAKGDADLMRARAEKAERERDALRGALIDLEQHARDVTEETGNTSHPTPPGKFYVPIVETHRLELAIDRAREAIGLPRLES